MNILKWLARKLEPYLIDDLQAGGHCSFCGKWISWKIIYKDWDWVICEECLKKYGKT